MDTESAAALSAFAAAASAVLTLVAVAIAAWTLAGARKDAAASAEQAATDRREQIRPFLTPELERELLSEGALNLVVKNWGRTPARDVTLTFTPPPPANLAALPDADMMKWLYQAYAQPIGLWPPQWRMSNVYRAGHDDVQPLDLLIEYKGPDGHRYSDSFYIDPEPLLKTTTSNPSDPTSADPQKREDVWRKRTTRALEALVRTLR